METSVHEIAPGIYRVSTFVSGVPPAGLTMNQFLVGGDEPLLFHCGPRWLFPPVSGAVARVMPLDRLRWIAFGHVEADECGSMNRWLAAAPHARVAHGEVGCQVSIDDLADRTPRRLADHEVLDLGGHRLRQIPTPHVPHNWEAQLFHDEQTGTLLCGDLFTQLGAGRPLVHDVDLVTPAIEAEEVFHATSLAPATAATIRALAELAPATLALMHGPTFTGDCVTALRDLATAYDRAREYGS
jgi:flavorubredoxin